MAIDTSFDGVQVRKVGVSCAPNMKLFVLVMIFFGACAAVLFHVARTNDRGVVINHLIELSANGASYFFGALALASLGFVLIAIVAIYRGFTSEREVIVSDDSITAPKSAISKRTVTFRFEDVNTMKVQKVQKTRVLHLATHQGKLSIPNNMIPGKTGFDDLVALVSSRLVRD